MEKNYSKFFTSLHRHKLSVVRNLVLNEGLSVNHQFGDSSTPIHIVAEKGHLDVVRFLIAAKAAIDVKNRHGQTALLLGINHPQIVHALITSGAHVNQSDPQRRTALHLACAMGLVQAASELIKAGAKISEQDKWGRMPLHVTLLNITRNHSVALNYRNLVDVLLEKGSMVNLGDVQNYTPLFLAVAAGDSCLEIAKLLIQFGAYPDKPSRHNLTPLMLAIMKGYESLGMFFLSMNCNVNKRITATKNSCLRTAVRKGYLRLAQLIVASGCNLRSETWLYQAWDLAVQAQSDNLLVWLRHIQTTVPSLKDCCRTVIRQSYGLDLQKIIHHIHYPQPLKGFILLEDQIPNEISNP